MEETASEDTKPNIEQLVHEDFDPNIKIKQEKNLTPPPSEQPDDDAPEDNDEDEKKPTEPVKSSKELLEELFSVFNAVPPEILLNDNESNDSVPEKKSKKKKHKEKKHKKKKKNDHDTDSREAKKRIKEEKHKDKPDNHSTERSIKIESVTGKKSKDGEDMTNIEITMSRTQRIQIKNLKNSLVLETRSHKDEERDRDRERRRRRSNNDSDFSISDVEESVKNWSRSAERKQRHKEHEDFDRFYASYNNHSWQKKDQDAGGRSTSSRSRRPDVKKERPERREPSRDRLEPVRPRRDERLHREEWSRGRKRSRSRSRSGERIDKKRLLEIARKNAIHMLRNGSLPGSSGLAPEAKDKIIANLKCTGKSVQELTDYCKKISEGDLGDLSNLSGEDSDHDRDGNNRAFHHPFVLKEREPIVMNIRNATAIPPKSAEQTKALSMQFPVSSGSAHKQKTDEWVPVSPKRQQVALLAKPGTSKPPKKKEIAPEAIPDVPSVGFHMEEAEALAAKSNEVFPQVSDNLDVSQIISQRLNAMRKLQDNPTDTQAKIMLQSAQQDMSKWATAKFIPGQFLGSTGVNPLSAKELASGYGPGPWAKKDQMITSKPLSGGMGMNLLQKMGWRPGEGLGKDKTGQLQPLLLEVKLDKKGLVSNDETAKPKRNIAPTRMTLEGKHPVSLLGELASKRRWGTPQYDVILESGPQHCKLFIFKVRLNGMEYQPSQGCNSKKEAKAVAAKFCLQQLGVLPT